MTSTESMRRGSDRIVEILTAHHKERPRGKEIGFSMAEVAKDGSFVYWIGQLRVFAPIKGGIWSVLAEGTLGTFFIDPKHRYERQEHRFSRTGQGHIRFVWQSDEEITIVISHPASSPVEERALVPTWVRYDAIYAVPGIQSNERVFMMRFS